MDYIEYSQEIYENKYHAKWTWIDEIHVPADLLANFATEEYYRARFHNWLMPFKLRGSLLELGFNSGKTAYWFAQKYPDLTVDGIDFSRPLAKIADLIPRLAPNLRNFVLGDFSELPFSNSTYQFISCLDVIEHLPEKKYAEMIDECHRVLVPGGLIFIHVGQFDCEWHINRIPHEQVMIDFALRGFRLHYAIPDFLVMSKV